jgi:hypothetical protein
VPALQRMEPAPAATPCRFSLRARVWSRRPPAQAGRRSPGLSRIVRNDSPFGVERYACFAPGHSGNAHPSRGDTLRPRYRAPRVASSHRKGESARSKLCSGLCALIRRGFARTFARRTRKEEPCEETGRDARDVCAPGPGVAQSVSGSGGSASSRARHDRQTRTPAVPGRGSAAAGSRRPAADIRIRRSERPPPLGTERWLADRSPAMGGKAGATSCHWRTISGGRARKRDCAVSSSVGHGLGPDWAHPKGAASRQSLRGAMRPVS